ncbi:hypothetical protein AVEN_162948-1 [Araneus ventricosus]|uniref:Uncharacterized protein n=1 Tax=Araneus ventricosus TaxID=182803 RepID=A0A4Y2C1K9_ARAVE|nr:hypothetical protein AVEN_162948-1 [Araneus ventricosus]
MKVTSCYQLSEKQDGSNFIFAFIPFWRPLALVTESSLQNVSSDDSMSHDSQKLIVSHSIHINPNFVASSKLCIIFGHQCTNNHKIVTSCTVRNAPQDCYSFMYNIYGTLVRLSTNSILKGKLLFPRSFTGPIALKSACAERSCSFCDVRNLKASVCHWAGWYFPVRLQSHVNEAAECKLQCF